MRALMYTDIEKKLEQHVKSIHLDLRVNDNHRFTDQKCKPDIVSAVAEAILMFVKEDPTKEFTTTDIRTSDFSNETMVSLFQKPAIGGSGTEREYDKVFAQPIRMFWTAQLIQKTGKNGNAFKYRIKHKEYLEYIALSDQRALNFLVIFLSKVISDSGLLPHFDRFFAEQSQSSYAKLKSDFEKIYLDNTQIRTVTEIRRIFPQVLNPLAFKMKSKGTEDGRLSKQLISYAALCYNRVNFRDIKKDKGISRADYIQSLGADTAAEAYQISRAKRKVKEYHAQGHVPLNEVYIHDATPHQQAHHIFPRSQYPEFSDTFENLVLLNPTQHHVYAHPNGDTNRVSKSYQLLCLLSKLNSIKASEIKNDSFYSLHEFINLVNSGLEQSVLSASMPIELIQQKLMTHFLPD